MSRGTPLRRIPLSTLPARRRIPAPHPPKTRIPSGPFYATHRERNPEKQGFPQVRTPSRVVQTDVGKAGPGNPCNAARPIERTPRGRESGKTEPFNRGLPGCPGLARGRFLRDAPGHPLAANPSQYLRKLWYPRHRNRLPQRRKQPSGVTRNESHGAGNPGNGTL